MVLTETLFDRSISIRSVKVSDAEFILGLRLDTKKNRFLNEVSDSVEKQEHWIEAQRARLRDYYFIIQDENRERIGTVGLYDIDEENGVFNWGRWIIQDGVSPTVLIESTHLIYRFGFEILKLKKACSEVRLGNFKVINFHISYGAKVVKIDELNAYYEFEDSQFSQFKSKFLKYIV